MKWIISDVHGNLKTLKALLEKLPKEATPKDIIFLGDLIDRGTNNRKVINFVRDGGYDCIMGNHEELMIEAMENFWEHNTPIWLSDWSHNGGDKTYTEYADDEEGLKKDIKWMKKLINHLIYYNEKDKMGRKLLISHAPCLDFIEEYWEMDDKDRRLFQLESLISWNRNIPKKEQTKYFNVFGHNIISNYIFNPSGGFRVDPSIITPEKTLFDNLKGYAAIDTGAFIKSDNPYNGRLTCLEFPTMKIYQQENIEEVK